MFRIRPIRGSFHEGLDDFQEPMQVRAVQIDSARCPGMPSKTLLTEASKAPDVIAPLSAKRRRALDAALTINDKLSAERTR